MAMKIFSIGCDAVWTGLMTGGSMFLRIVDVYLSVRMASQPQKNNIVESHSWRQPAVCIRTYFYPSYLLRSDWHEQAAASC
jgi:hypothetical protein